MKALGEEAHKETIKVYPVVGSSSARIELICSSLDELVCADKPCKTSKKSFKFKLRLHYSE